MKQIFHPYWNWECFHSGMFSTSCGIDQPKERYAAFLRDSDLFDREAKKMIAAWPKSCEHFLTNMSINRIAWMGQASACFHLGLPRKFRCGFMLLTRQEQRAANAVAHRRILLWEQSTKLSSTKADGKKWATPKESQTRFPWK